MVLCAVYTTPCCALCAGDGHQCCVLVTVHNTGDQCVLCAGDGVVCCVLVMVLCAVCW